MKVFTSFAARSLYYKLQKIKFTPIRKPNNDWHLGQSIHFYGMEFESQGYASTNWNVLGQKKSKSRIYEIIRRNRKLYKEERDGYAKPNRRERKWTSEELLRRIEPPLSSWLYGRSYYEVMKYAKDNSPPSVVKPEGGETKVPLKLSAAKSEANQDTTGEARNLKKYEGTYGVICTKERCGEFRNWFIWRWFPPLDICVMLRMRSQLTNIIYIGWNSVSYAIVGVIIPVGALLTTAKNLIERRFMDYLLLEPKPNWAQAGIPALISLWYTWWISEEAIKVWAEDLHQNIPETDTNSNSGNNECDSSRLPVVLFVITCIIFGMFVYFHSETAFVVQQNNTLESIVRDQASIITGQRIHMELQQEDIRRLSEALSARINND